MEAGEYRKIFNEKYDLLKTTNNLNLLKNPKSILKIISTTHER